MHCFKKGQEQEYIIERECIVSGFDAALNDVYRQLYPDLEEMKEGDVAVVKEIPLYYFKYKGRKWPVYDDDAGQQEYIYINGEFVGAGSFTPYPYSVEFFMYKIDKLNQD